MAKKTCPLLRKPCIESKCMLWREMVFTAAGSDKPEVIYDCSFNWNVVMQIENSKQVRELAASTDKVANEINAAAGTLIVARAGYTPQFEREKERQRLEKPDEDRDPT